MFGGCLLCLEFCNKQESCSLKDDSFMRESEAIE